MTVSAAFTLERNAFTLKVNLVLRDGEVTAIVGPNGAGKTTLLRALAGLESISSGQIRLDDEVVDDAMSTFVQPRNRACGYFFQNYVLFPHLSALENVAFGLRSRGVPRKEARTQAERLLAQVGIASLSARKPASLSGGQAQRVALARALACKPSLLLLDEPLSAADAATKNDLRAGLVERLRAFDGCCVLVTHDPVDALLLADRVIVLEQGEVVQDDSPADLAAHPRTNYVAALMSLNLIRGEAAEGVLRFGDGREVHIADQSLRGPAAAVVRPEAIGVHREQPLGSARNVWRGVVTLIQPWEDRVRVHVEAETAMVATITTEACAELTLEPGAMVWMSAKAVDIRTYSLAPSNVAEPL
ncbi:MAG: ABC transporter ATP-binding protein [Actinomycetota bacterium]|nr:ABC transporter ATP-binding protein [Actinomycetota bacterium]